MMKLRFRVLFCFLFCNNASSNIFGAQLFILILFLLVTGTNAILARLIKVYNLPLGC